MTDPPAGRIITICNQHVHLLVQCVTIISCNVIMQSHKNCEKHISEYVPSFPSVHLSVLVK
jgi:hypothetical protein